MREATLVWWRLSWILGAKSSYAIKRFFIDYKNIIIVDGKPLCSLSS